MIFNITLRAFILVLACVSVMAIAGGPREKAPELTDAWEVSSDLHQPESAFCDETEGAIFVSNVTGDAEKKDGKGSIHKFDLKGKMIDEDFVDGLNAPKGMRRTGDYLVVSDIDEVVFVDVKNGDVKLKIKVDGAKFLNDVATDEKGDVYVTDTLASMVYQIKAPFTKDSHAFEYLKGKQWESPNGILVEGGRVFLASWGLTTDFSTKTPGRLLDIDQNKKKLGIVTKKPLGNLDGLERADAKHFFVSDWTAGKVFYVGPLGVIHTLKEGYKGAADLGWCAKAKLLIVPRMGEDKLSAFNVKF